MPCCIIYRSQQYPLYSSTPCTVITPYSTSCSASAVPLAPLQKPAGGEAGEAASGSNGHLSSCNSHDGRHDQDEDADDGHHDKDEDADDAKNYPECDE